MQTTLIILLTVALAVDIGMLCFAITRQDKSRSIYFAVLTAALFMYTLGYLLEVLCSMPESAMIAIRVENVGIPSIAPFFLLTIISLFQPQRLRPWFFPVAMGYGLLLSAVIFFNDSHHLYYTFLEMVHDGSSYFVSLGHGVLYYVQQAVSISAMLLTYFLIFKRFVRSSKSLRRQMLLTMVGSMIALVANILNFTDVLPVGLDPTPFALTVGLLLFSINLLRYKLMDIVAIASNSALKTMDDAIIVLEKDWGFSFCNLKAKELFPQLAEFLGSEQVTMIAGWPEELSGHHGAGQITFGHTHPDGRSLTFRANISEVLAGRGELAGWSIVLRDVTDMVALMNQLETLATLDPLTGILNRRQFFASAAREMDLARRQGFHNALIMFDLDYFKVINDKYGHVAGDHVLKSVVGAVQAQLRSYDIFARYGGEEFIIFTTAVSGDDLISFATRLCEAVRQCDIFFEGVRIPITASFGVVEIPPEGSIDEALLAVDDALYQAKDGGRNRVFSAVMAKGKTP